eukprot:1191346-Prorocentrum_minimum.AAC.3
MLNDVDSWNQNVFDVDPCDAFWFSPPSPPACVGDIPEGKGFKTVEICYNLSDIFHDLLFHEIRTIRHSWTSTGLGHDLSSCTHKLNICCPLSD